ncbi:sodium/substrate symporter small subunit [Marinobacterium sp. MBR-109]|jgi:putative solute:sodium symporter small subunit|uniref:sodium/substrate symporter small subunit n=1 Tax=Marinobacterium sp. MBR-109 TaxID=3156462 RepID=UPI0033987584
MSSGTGGAKAYRRENLRVILTCLVICFAVLYGCGAVFIAEPHHIRLSNVHPDFRFDQEGSVHLFIVLVWAYVFGMSQPRPDLELQE